jgi:hypothetical protein
VVVALAAICAILVIVGSAGPWITTKECEGENCETTGIDLEDSGYLFFVGDDIFGIQEGWVTIGLAAVGILAVVLGLAVRPRAVPLAVGGVVLLAAGVVGVIDWASLAIFISDFEGALGAEGLLEIGWGLPLTTIAAFLAGILSLVAIAVDSSANRRAVAGTPPPGYPTAGVAPPTPGSNEPVLNDGVWWVRGPDNGWLYWDEATAQWVPSQR